MITNINSVQDSFINSYILLKQENQDNDLEKQKKIQQILDGYELELQKSDDKRVERYICRKIDKKK